MWFFTLISAIYWYCYRYYDYDRLTFLCKIIIDLYLTLIRCWLQTGLVFITVRWIWKIQNKWVVLTMNLWIWGIPPRWLTSLSCLQPHDRCVISAHGSIEPTAVWSPVKPHSSPISGYAFTESKGRTVKIIQFVPCYPALGSLSLPDLRVVMAEITV